MEEIWKDIEGYENKYQVSNLGNVRSLNFNNTGEPRNLKQKINRYGYNEVKLSKNNKTKNFLVSTLVAKAFLNKVNPDKEVMHIGDINDNSVDNLKYGYRSEILHRTYKRGRRKIGRPTKNFMSYNGKQYKRYSDIARDYELNPHRLLKRLSSGWTMEEAVSIPVERKKRTLQVKLYNYNGKLMSLKQLSEMSGIGMSTLYHRIYRGWSIEEAVEIPTKNKLERNKENEKRF